MTPFEASKLIEEKLAAARGKAVLMQRDPNCSGHASIKIASNFADAYVNPVISNQHIEFEQFSEWSAHVLIRSLFQSEQLLNFRPNL